MRRRDLLAAAALWQPERRLKTAFLGVSHPHAPGKVRLVAASPDFELAGAWEPDSAVRARYQPPRWMEKREILADPSIGVVFVESEVKSHGPLAIEALAAGKHVHIEKPASDDLAGMKRLVELARSKRLHIQAGYMWRYHPAVRKAIELGRNGWLGQIYLVQARMNTLVDAGSRPAWELYAGGQMFEQGCHLVDIVVRLLGRPGKVTPFLRHDGDFADKMKDNTAAVLEYPRAMAILVAGTLQPNARPHRALEIFGSNGTAVLRPIEPPSLEIDLQKPAGPYAAGRQKVPLEPYEPYAGDIAALARVIRGQEPPVASLEDELLVEETLLRVSGMEA